LCRLFFFEDLPAMIADVPPVPGSDMLIAGPLFAVESIAALPLGVRSRTLMRCPFVAP
jgi:hypothetical protein